MSGSIRHGEKNPRLCSCCSNKSAPDTVSAQELVLPSRERHTTFPVLRLLSEAGVQGGHAIEGLGSSLVLLTMTASIFSCI